MISLREGVPVDEQINGHSHIRSLFFNSSENVPIKDSKLLLGQWKRIFFVELDPMRNRELIITFIKALIEMKIFTIIKEDSKRIPNKNFVDVNGHPLWWHLLSELEGLDVTVNTDSQKFIKQLEESNLKSVRVIKRHQKHIDWENDKSIDSSPVEDMLFDFCEDT